MNIVVHASFAECNPVLSPFAQRFRERGRPVTQPTIELGLILQVLSPHARHGDEGAI
jgi:hypothetical protein